MCITCTGFLCNRVQLVHRQSINFRSRISSHKPYNILMSRFLASTITTVHPLRRRTAFAIKLERTREKGGRALEFSPLFLATPLRPIMIRKNTRRRAQNLRANLSMNSRNELDAT